MTLRYDNALHVDDSSTVDARKESGNPFPETAPGRNTNEETGA